jgi:hypothetical protein
VQHDVGCREIRLTVALDDQPPGHPQAGDQAASGGKLEYGVLPAAMGAYQALARQFAGKSVAAGRDGDFGKPDLDTVDSLTDDVRSQTADDRLDLGKLGQKAVP